MSMELMVKAMKAKVGNPLRKLVLIKLADNASDSGECWPSYQHIADQCEITRRSVMTHVKDLEKEGFLRREFRKGEKGNSTNIFHLNLVSINTQLPSEGDSLPSEGDSLPSEGDSLTPSESPSPRTSHSLEPVNEPLKDIPKSLKPKLDFSCWPALPSEQTLKDWLAVRKQKKAALNQTAINRLAKHLHEAVEAGFTVEDCIATCATRGWVAFESAWLFNAGIARNGATSGEQGSWSEQVFNDGDPLI
ncbi:helix-turn-helix domain-containing protein [Shewanella sp. Isolate11]|uniref:helix-turn-helix domain-containing protein n=1 Tax=Shewanella sp. Isolate11 TaxID=2908530 RepID=UPI001EFD46CC|nr:helix-turn-helix domain-containing protein [Shewanella sp. Isolate11]MCG9697446.1 helix-turn-helix domain-containing protein [Shewanella sp. Isolate11]